MLGRRGPESGTAIGIGDEVIVSVDQARQQRLASQVDGPRWKFACASLDPADSVAGD
jgi:hypothetical protein